MSEGTIPVTPEVTRRVLDRLISRLPDGWRLMPIGGTEMAIADDAAATTKDVDVVLVTLDGDRATIPDYRDLVTFANQLSGTVQTRKDHTAVKLVLSTDAGPVTLELIRGRTPGQGGYFVSRSVLETAATLATDDDGVLRLPTEALAFLKAWAASDKQKLVDAGKDPRGYHAGRREAFLADVQRLRQAVADAGGSPIMRSSRPCSLRPVASGRRRSVGSWPNASGRRDPAVGDRLADPSPLRRPQPAPIASNRNPGQVPPPRAVGPSTTWTESLAACKPDPGTPHPGSPSSAWPTRHC